MTFEECMEKAFVEIGVAPQRGTPAWRVCKYVWDSAGEEKKADESLVRAAYAWWAGKRPTIWDFKAHTEHPGVNCTSDAERDLAGAVAGNLTAQG